MLPNSSQPLPPGQQLVAPGKWPIIGETQPAMSDRPWSLTISGETADSATFTVAQLRDFPQTPQTVDIHCVTRWSKLAVQFNGVLLSDLLKVVVPDASAHYVSFVSRSDRQHSSSLLLSTALALQTLIALDVDGQPLGVEHGGPVRNVVPGRYFYKSVKWIEKIELLSRDRLGFWESESGYHNGADPWQEQRYLAATIDKRTAAQLIESKNFSALNLLSLSAANRDLQNLIARQALLRNADFSNSDLRNADFTSANLSNARLECADLRGAILLNADAEGANFNGADLRGANLTGCSLIGASFFNPQISAGEAIFDRTTVFPDDVRAPLFPEQAEFVASALADLQ